MVSQLTSDKTDNFDFPKKKIGRRLKPSDPDFVPPDGGWGWLIVCACGLSNLSIFTMLQQFGLVLPNKFHEMGITDTQTTTIININLALTSCIGLLNGPIYRRFSFRQVGLFGSSLVVSSLFIIIWCKSFWSYFVFYSLLFGSSAGLTQSANALALNTYFKNKRSIATGFSWGITGIGPIVWPYIVTVSMNYYGTDGTILLFAGFAGHSILCSLLLQPVYWHTKYREETGVPLKPLNSKIKVIRSNSLPVYLNRLDEITIMDSPQLQDTDSSSNSVNVKSNNNITITESKKHSLSEQLVEISSLEKKQNTHIKIFTKDKSVITKPVAEPIYISRIIKYFDLNILKDLVYLNIIFGMVTVCFVECNFAILTPIILREFNFEKYQIATYMSLVGATDVIVRFSIPFVANKIKWHHRIYYMLGTLLTTIGRIILVHTQQFSISLFVAVLVGFGKGLCVIYLALLIPNHVSLSKLPAAMGIYLAAFGLFLILMAPIIGWLRDITHSYVATIHILHILIYISALSWIIEYFCKKRRFRTK